MDRKKDIVNMINKISGKYSAYEVFSDWIRLCALSINNSLCFLHDSVWEERERLYLDTAAKYSRDEMMMFTEMLSYLLVTLEKPHDALGEIYMMSGMGSKAAGQFFTPYHLSRLTAEVALESYNGGKIVLNEPSCGGGGMIIAAASILKEKGINYQKNLDVVAQDLDLKAVYMCYIQLSFLGIKGTVVQGNTLEMTGLHGYPKNKIFHTPAKMGVIV